MYDLILKGGSVIDAHNGRVFSADVAIKDGVIASVGENLSGGRELDVGGKVLSAGLIDAHVHVESSMLAPFEFGRAVLPFGTTAVIADPHEIVNVGGISSLDYFLNLSKASPVDILVTAPSCVPATMLDTNGAGVVTADMLEKYAKDSRVVGLGEVMDFLGVQAKDAQLLKKIEIFKRAGKVIDGHTVGITGEGLEAYAMAGVDNDHECTTYEEAVKRLRAGMKVYIREGSGAHNLKPIVEGIVENKPDLKDFAFCTDDKHITDIIKSGSILYNVKCAVGYGMDALDALRLATLNPAEFYGLKNRGEIKEGCIADIVVFDNLCDFNPLLVIKDGNVAAEKGEISKDYGKIEYNPENSLKYDDLTLNRIAIEKKETYTAIGLVKFELLTKKVTLSAKEALTASKVVAVERHGKNGNVAAAYVVGYGLSGGALATSIAHDSHNVIALGDNDEDIVTAVNRLKEIGGGYVLVREGEIAAELPLKIAGIMSSDTAENVARLSKCIHKAAREMGVPKGIDPFHSLSFLSLPVIPELRLLDTGLYSVTEGRFIAD